MDNTEDLSARVLLKHILRTETPKTPVAHSNYQAPSTSVLRRSSRSRRKDVKPETPQNILRRSLKKKVQESITRKSLPASKLRTASVILTKLPSVSLLSDEDTPRRLLRNILLTEPAKSPVVHEKGPPKKPEPQSADKTTTGTRSSIELSGLDLPDLTIGNAASTAKGLNRKRPHRSLNVTAFEKKLKDIHDAEEETNISTDDHSSLSLSSSSLSLKTPFVDAQTEKRGLKRKVSDRRKVTKEEFEAALNKQQIGGPGSHDFVEGNLGEVTNFEGFTLGLSKLGESDITADIVNYNTALYAQPDAMASTFSILATQDKPTVMASQLQRHAEMEQEDEHSRMKDKSVDVFLSEEAATPPQNDECISDSRMQEDVTGSHEGCQNLADAGLILKFGKEEDEVESEIGEADDQAESEEVETQTEEEDVSNPRSEEDDELEDVTEKNKVSPDSQTEKEEEIAETEACAAKSQSEEVESSHSEEEEDAQGSQAEEILASSSSEEAVEAGIRSRFEEDVAEFQTGNEFNEQMEEEEEALEHLEDDLDHISRRAHRSEGAPVLPVTKTRDDMTNTSAAGWSESEAHSSHGLTVSRGTGNRDGSLPRSGSPDWTKPSVHDEDQVVGTENDSEAEDNDSFRLHGVTQDIEVSRQRSEFSSEESPDQEDANQEDWEDEEDDVDKDVEEFPSKTPAFVKKKRIFYPDPSASTSVLKNIQASEALPAAKPKKVRQRKTKAATKQGVFPKSYLMSTFRHFAKIRVSADVYPVLNEIMDTFFTRMVEDLETYAAHANRKTIEVEDAVLLLKRQGHVNDKVPVEALIEQYLRMEQRKILIPIATSGNVVFPKKRLS